MSVDVDYAHTSVAERNRATKAHALAVHAWRHALTGDDLRTLEEATRREFARDAAVRQPSPASWSAAIDRLDVLWSYASSPNAPAQDLASDRGRWAAPLAEGEHVAIGVDPAADETSEVAVVLVTPRGWHLLAALGPVTGFPRTPTCKTCGAPAVVGTVESWRCGEHPPQPGEWGAGVDWTPTPDRPCLEGRCYCGRCPSFRPLGPIRYTPPTEDTRRSRR